MKLFLEKVTASADAGYQAFKQFFHEL